MQDPDPKCRHFVISWHFMAFWHVCQKANCLTKSAFSAFSCLSAFFTELDFRLSSSSCNAFGKTHPRAHHFGWHLRWFCNQDYSKADRSFKIMETVVFLSFRKPSKLLNGANLLQKYNVWPVLWTDHCTWTKLERRVSFLELNNSPGVAHQTSTLISSKPRNHAFTHLFSQMERTNDCQILAFEVILSVFTKCRFWG